MSFIVKCGNLFENVKHGYIIHGCNAQGVMGSGVAAIIRNDYPVAYQAYIAQNPYYILGEVIPAKVDDNLVIINAITQEYYGTDRVHADYAAIEQAMKGLKHLVESGMIESKEIHFPFIGGGLAGGDPHTLLTIFDQQFSDSITDLEATLWLLPDMYDSLYNQ